MKDRRSGEREAAIHAIVPVAILAVVAAIALISGHSSGVRYAGIAAGPTAAAQPAACESANPPAPLLSPEGVPALDIKYVPVAKEPEGFVTKFGGQPKWVGKPEWPLSRSTGKPMVFIGQVSLDHALFPGATGRMAYLFVTGDDDYVNGAEPWDPDAGENAIVVQPGDKPIVATTHSAKGPTTLTWATGTTSQRPVIYRAVFTPSQDPAFVGDTARQELTQQQNDAYETAIGPDKIGGTPDFFQGAEFPCSGERLLYQVGYQPFDLNLGDGGAGFAFINATGTAGRFLTQSH
jgi:hypothetical protein